MDLDELRGVQSTERQRDSLQHLRDSFYEDVASYIEGRKHRRDDRASSVENPFSDEQVRKLSDEIETAEEVVESLYERRVGKVVKLASFAAADAPVETDGLTAEETELFDDLVARIEENKGRVLEVLGGGADVDLDAPTGAEPTTPSTDDEVGTEPTAADAGGEPDGVLADAMGADSAAPRESGTTDAGGHESEDAPPIPPDEPELEHGAGGSVQDVESGASEGEDGSTGDGARPSGEAPPSDDDRRTVRITRDVGQILGVDDREYELESEDVVTLPAANADPLVDRDAADPLE
ncbi:hypothetical protein [Halorarum halobium]|uniref:DNA replication complex subunit Gins51 n=1 Tax=Halorarum halobium TaxID=3075121 RepID=UPI0028A9F9AB|nr:hypothetical protein [Halobaculum sp. XH14]